MKKLLCLILCLCGILFACGEKNIPYFTVGYYTAAVGETVTVQITLSENSGVAATDLQFSYDPGALTYLSFESGKDFKGGIGDANLEKEGLVKICLATLTPPEKECVVATLAFTVKEGAKGEYPLDVVCTSCYDSQGKPIEILYSSGNICIEN